MKIDPQAPHNELPELPPKQDLESKEVLRASIAANKAVAELKGLAQM